MFAGKSFHQCKITMTPSLSISYTPLHIPNFLAQLSLFLFFCFIFTTRERWRQKSQWGGGTEPWCQFSGVQPSQVPNTPELLHVLQRHRFESFDSAHTLLFLDLFLPGCCSVMTMQSLKILSLQSLPWHKGTCKKAFLITFWFWAVFVIANNVAYFCVTTGKENYVYAYISTIVENCPYTKSHFLFVTDKNINWLIFSFIKTLNYKCSAFSDFQDNFFPPEGWFSFKKPWTLMYYTNKSNDWCIPIVTLQLEVCGLLLPIWIVINIIIRFLHKAMIFPKELQIFCCI